MKFSIVIPCYNEKENIPLILDQFSSVIKRGDIEVVLVDNGSSDGTDELLKQLAPKFSFLKLVKVSVNQGYGYGILAGLNVAKGDYLGWTHGDLQTPPADVIKALQMIENLGSPLNIYIKGHRTRRKIFDLFFTVGMSFFEWMVLKKWLWDINAQPNIFHRNFYLSWKNAPNDFSLDLFVYYLAKKAKLNIQRFDVSFLPRIHGESRWNKDMASKWRFIKRTTDFSLKLRKRLSF